jgi:pre-mRNA-splicing factor 18
MEALKAEIALKRKAVQNDADTRPSKYVRRGELERMKEEEERRAREEKEKERAAEQAAERDTALARSRQKKTVSSSCHLHC